MVGDARLLILLPLETRQVDNIVVLTLKPGGQNVSRLSYSTNNRSILWTHKYALEHEILYDKVMKMFAAKLEHCAGVVPETVDEDVIISLEDEGPALAMGWALKSAAVTRKNLTATQKTYSHCSVPGRRTYRAKG